jgi:hypothetical protein
VNGGDDHEAPVAGRRERVPGVFGEQEGTRQQEADEGVPAILGEVGDRRDMLETGVRDDGVEPPEALERGLDSRAISLPRRQVGFERFARAGVVGLEVDGEYERAVAVEALRDRAPDPAGRARDDDRAPAQVVRAHAEAR